MYKLDKNELTLRQAARGCYPKESMWYAVMTHYGQEQRVRKFIEENMADQRIDEILLPLVQLGRSSRSSQPKALPRFLFRSYLFLRCMMNDDTYISICDHPSVYQILGRGYRIPTVLDDAEIQNLRQVLNADCNPEMVTRCNIGASALIIDGLMAGVRGRVIAVNSKEVKLEISFSFLSMGTGIVVAVPRSQVRIRENSHRESVEKRMCHV